jgi:TonB family protein
MSASTLATALIAWTLQITLLLGLGLLLPALFRLRAPRASLAYGQGLLLAVLLLPLLQSLPRTGMEGLSAQMTVSGRWLGQLGASSPDAGASWSWPQLLLLGAGLGAALRLVWLGAGLLLLRSWRQGARPAELAPEVVEVIQRFGARARLLVSPRIDSPVTFGWRRPAVLLPAGFATLPAEAQRGIVCHELLHVRRRDWLFALWEEGVRSLLWFHPAVWMLLARIALSREQVVDGEVVRLTGSRRAYLEALHAMASRSRQLAVPGLPFFHRGHLRERVVHLCKEVPMSRPRVVALVITFAVLLALTAAIGILAFPMGGKTPTASKTKTWTGPEPLEIQGEVQNAEPLYTVPPVKPEVRRNHSYPPVSMRIIVDQEGKVHDPTVTGSSGDPAIDQAVMDTIAQWTFKPATLHGKPVPAYVDIMLGTNY